MAKRILFFLGDSGYGSGKFYRLAAAMSDERYADVVTPVILTTEKTFLERAREDGMEAVQFSPSYRRLKSSLLQMFPFLYVAEGPAREAACKTVTWMLTGRDE